MFSTVLSISTCFLILQCTLTDVSTVLCEENIFDYAKAVGEPYGLRLQKLEDSIVYKFDRPSNDTWKTIIEDMEASVNLLEDFLIRLRLDDKEEIKYAQEFAKNGVPQILTRNYTEITFLEAFNLKPLEMAKFHNAIRNFAECWKFFRDPYFKECYGSGEVYKNAIKRYGRSEVRFDNLSAIWESVKNRVNILWPKLNKHKE